MGVGTGQLHCCGQLLISLNTKTAAGEEHAMLMDYVDIGTSDFETSLDVWHPGCRILLVEPLQHYLSQGLVLITAAHWQSLDC
jgi:hypothetical protein